MYDPSNKHEIIIPSMGMSDINVHNRICPFVGNLIVKSDVQEYLHQMRMMKSISAGPRIKM